MTLGEFRVGITFNPSSDERVNKIKRQAADLIDYIDEYKKEIPHDVEVPEVLRLIALAQTHIEDAAMWAVKAVTKRPKE